MTGQPSRTRRWFNSRIGQAGSWLLEHNHASAALRLWRACGLMAGNKPARITQQPGAIGHQITVAGTGTEPSTTWTDISAPDPTATIQFAEAWPAVTIEVPFPPPRPPGFKPCRVYWGSHGCHLERGHLEPCRCNCCDCTNHPDPDPDNPGSAPSCVAGPPYYGPCTRFYGEDAAARGLPL